MPAFDLAGRNEVTQKLVVVDLHADALRLDVFNYLSGLGECKLLIPVAYIVETELTVQDLLSGLLNDIGCFSDSSVCVIEMLSPLAHYNYKVCQSFNNSLKQLV